MIVFFLSFFIFPGSPFTSNHNVINNLYLIILLSGTGYDLSSKIIEHNVLFSTED